MFRDLNAEVHLKHKVTVYVPTRDRHNEELTVSMVKDMEHDVARSMSEINGGATITDGTGYWISSDGTPVIEDVRLVHSYTDDLDRSLDVASNLVHMIKDRANQDAVSLEVDNELYIM